MKGTDCLCLSCEKLGPNTFQPRSFMQLTQEAVKLILIGH